MADKKELGVLSRRSFVRIAGTSALLLAAASLYSCSKTTGESKQTQQGCTSESTFTQPEPLTCTLFAFDTVITLSAYCSQDVLDAAAARCEYFEGIFSRTVEGSDIWRINEAKGAPVEVSRETVDIIEQALSYSKASDGQFDITIGAVSSLWDFKKAVKPSDAAIKAALPHIGYENIHVDGTTVQLVDPLAKIDLGGIAKGYIADDLSALFRAQGCESACINLGGNVAIVGRKPNGKAYQVGIQDPNAQRDDVVAALACTDASVVTSGLYEREFTLDGTRYYHILDPKTGYPVETDLVSSSVRSEKSIDGDVYATMLFLQGRDKALETLEADYRFEGLLVDTQGAVAQTSGEVFTILGS